MPVIVALEDFIGQASPEVDRPSPFGTYVVFDGYGDRLVVVTREKFVDKACHRTDEPSPFEVYVVFNG